MDNRRKHQRHRVSLKGRLNTEGRPVTAQVDNLSEGGARVSLDAPLLEGSLVELYLKLPNGAGGDRASLRAVGNVIWCQEHMDVGFQAGISFTSIANEMSEQLLTYLATREPS
jgi:hypothetical protein